MALAAALMTLVALVGFGRWATASRLALTGTPGPPPFAKVTPIAVAPGREVCVGDVALEPSSARALWRTGDVRTRTPPVVVRVRGEDGFRATGRAPGGVGANTQLAVGFPAPPRSTFASVCLRNAGPGRLTLQGSTEPRAATRSTTTLDGRPIAPRLSLALAQARDRSVASRVGEILDHASAFSVPRPLLAVLALLVVAGVPLGVLGGMALALREEDR